MDPLSLTASLIAVLGAGGTIAKGLGRIRCLKKAPDVLLQLNNEVADLHLLIRAVHELHHGRTELLSASTIQEEVVCNSIERAKHAVLELEKLVEYVLTKEAKGGTEIDGLAWTRALNRIKEVRNKVRTAREDLNAVWTTLSNKHISRRIELKLQDTNVTISSLQSILHSQINTMDPTVKAASRHEQLSRIIQQQTYYNEGRELPPERSQPLQNSTMHPVAVVSQGIIHPSESTGSSEQLNFRLARREMCKSHCTCSCHLQSRLRSPSFLNNVLGSLFIGYVGYTTCLTKCNSRTCRRHIKIKGCLLYTFPKWFVEMAVFPRIELSKGKGPEMLLRCLCVREYTKTLSFQALAQGHFDQVRSLVIGNEASVLDVSQRGMSLLAYSIRSFGRHPDYRDSYVQLIEFLLQEGADLFQEDSFTRSSYTELWRLNVLDPSSVQKYPNLLSLLNKGDPSDIFGFSDLHCAVFQLKPTKTFADQIGLTLRDEIDQPDCTGRTTLSWAAELREIDMIMKLLMNGADPNKGDISGSTPLTYCALNPQCLTMLLEAGAHVDHVNHFGQTKLAVLIRIKDDVNCARVLWKFEANINHRDDIGDAIIDSAISRYRPHFLTWLLEQEIDIEACALTGSNPLLFILENSQGRWSDMLTIILKRKPNYQVINELRKGVLHYIARCGSIRYIALFQQLADLSSLDADRRGIAGFKFNEKSHRGYTAMEVAKWRRDCQSDWALECLMDLDPDPFAWFAAFESWIDSIRVAHNAKMAASMGTNIETSARGVSVQGGGIELDEVADRDQEVRLRIPGRYPTEDEEQP